MCYQPEGYRSLTLSDVSRAFHQLLTLNGQTTSLDVKNYLRRQGYWAVQEDVAPVLRLMANEESIDYESNGLFRIYYYTEEREDQNIFVQLRSFSLN